MTDKELMELAVQARERAYVPYSQFKVGAALLDAQGRIYLGCNIENAAFSPTNCAERTAIFKAVSEGVREFKALAVVADTEEPVTPCGVCRQVMAEFFDPQMPIYLGNLRGDVLKTSLAELLPASFISKDLESGAAMTERFKSGFVAVVGRPNVGKSTLMNALLGQKVAIVSDKPQTTRNTIRGVLTLEHAQIVFLDTPGLHKPLHKLGEYMVKSAFQALEDVDLVLWLVEAGRWTAADDHILGELAAVRQPIILVANKADQVSPGEQEAFLRVAGQKRDFAAALAVSALQGTNLGELIELIVERLAEGPKYYPDDWLSDQPERFIVAEFIREELFLRTEQEVPHSIAVDVEEIKEDPEKNLMRIRATIYVERESQKDLVIGRGGRMLKEVGTSARLQMERLLGTQVHLELWVKVKKDLRNKPGALRELGYE